MTNSSASPLASDVPRNAKNTIWNDERRSRLEDAWGRGVSAFEIAGILSTDGVTITENAVKVQATRMNLSKRYKSDVDHALSVNGPSKRIRCMRCTRLFLSEGKHNRICDPCKGGADWSDAGPFYLIATASHRSSARPKDGS